MKRMRFLAETALAVSTLAACSSGQLGGDQSKDPTTSPGTVTLRLLLSPTQTYCDVIDGCSAPTHIFIGKESGTWLTPSAGPYCSPQCSNQCAQPPCPAIGACPAIAVGLPVTSVETTWNGSYVEWSTCGASIACYAPKYVPPGRYVARLCATPGSLVITDSTTNNQTCMPTAPQGCVETTFDLPGEPVVEVPLPLAQGN